LVDIFLRDRLRRELREWLYPPLAHIANEWAARLGERRFPVTHGQLAAECAAAGQARPHPAAPALRPRRSRQPAPGPVRRRGIKDGQTGERPAARYAGLDYDPGDLRETGAAVATTTFRPSEDQAVLVVAAADPEAVEAHLRPQLGQLLCVIPSNWTRAELEAVSAHLLAHHDDWNLYSWGDTSSEDGHALITARLTRILPEIATWAATLPAGILRLVS
jgi:hypothetical protein